MLPNARCCLAAAVLALAAAGALPAQSGPFTAAQVARVDARFAPYSTPDAPGCAVGIAEGPTHSLTRAYGSANLEHGVLVTTATPFNIGSVGKPFTAFATLLLEQAGRLSLDDPVSKYVEGMPTGGGTIRVRDLLDHTSGLRDVDGIGQLSGEHVRTMPEFLAQVRRQRTTQFPVGSRQEYSHSDYTLLSEVIAAAAGMSYARFLDSAVFVPLGMRHAGVFDGARRPIPGRAAPYRVDEDGTIHIATLSSELVGNSNIFLSVEDMLRWGANARSGAVGGPALVERLLAMPMQSASRPMAYRHGLWHETYRGEAVLVRKGHGGAHSSGFLRMPGRDLTVAVLCNRANVDMMPLVLAAADVRLDDLLPPGPDPLRDTIPPPPGEAARLAGTYAVANIPWSPIRLVAAGDRLLEDIPGALLPLERLRDGRWHSEGFTYAFESGPDGAATQLTLQGPDTHEVGVRMPASARWRPARAELEAVAGRYESDEAMATWKITLVGDTFLRLARPGLPATMLRPVVRDVFSAQVLTASGYQTEIGLELDRDAAGRVTGFRASAVPAAFEGARGLRFERVR